MAVTVGHAAAPQHLRGVQQRLAVFLVRLELIEEVAELLDKEGIGLRQAAQLLGIAVVMRQAVARLRNADVGNARRRCDSLPIMQVMTRGRVGAQGHDHQIVEQAVVFAAPGSCRACASDGASSARIDLGLGNVEPRFGALGANFHLADGGEIFVELGAVFAAELAVDALGVVGDGIEDAAAAAEPAADRAPCSPSPRRRAC